MRATMLFLGTIARLPLRTRRLLLRAAWRLSLSFRRDVGFSLEPLLEKYLRLGASDARRIAVEHDFQDQLQIMEWLASGLRSERQMLADYAHAGVSDPALALRLAESGESVILAPLHMGVFPFGISFVMWKYFAGRRVLVLRAREDNEDNNVAMDRLRAIASELRILNTRNEADFMEAMRFARKGAVVISMIDLPETYGAPVEATLFGEPVRLAFGLDAMARMLKAVVLPVSVCSSVAGDRVVFGEPFEVWENTAEDRAALAAHVARQIERFVHLDPAQWHMWTRILEFIAPRKSTSPPPPAAIEAEVAERIVSDAAA